MNEKLKPKNNGSSKHRPIPYPWIQLIIALIVLLDQTSKLLVPGFFATSCNKGIVFGIFSGGLLNLIVPLAVLFLLVHLLSKEKDWILAVSLILIIGGGVSNLLDRIFLGCVRDFISIRPIPSFNLADSAITVGVLLLIFSQVKNLAKNKFEDGS